MEQNIIERFKLNGKVALVTGGAGLYGRQMVKALLEAGAKVYVASRTLSKCQELADSLKEEGFDKVYAETYDQANEGSIKDLLTRLIEKENKIDILVNNSVLRTMRNYDDPIENFEKSMQVNATGVFAITRAFGNQMEKQGYGSIINIGSYMGICGSNHYLYEEAPQMNALICPDYFFHKGGMVNLTRFMAGRYGKAGVRVNCLNLGGFYNGQPQEFVKRYNEMTYLGRMANENDIQGAIVFLASDASSYITGTSINIDGGYTAR